MATDIARTVHRQATAEQSADPTQEQQTKQQPHSHPSPAQPPT